MDVGVRAGVRQVTKGTVGLVDPPATGWGWGHGCLTGFTPLLHEHTELRDWSAAPANQRAGAPLNTTAAGSASDWLLGSSILYESERQ